MNFPSEFLFIPLIFGIFGIPAFAYAIAGALRKRRILMHGGLRPAKLLAMTPVSSFGPFGGGWFKTRFETSYAFKADDGSERFGRSLTTDLSLLNDKKRGDEVEILVLPTSDRHTLILDSKARQLLDRAPPLLQGGA
jgi:hypothetical protein